jgi:uncharacterized repeat protein (TIGR01451 family)
MNIFKLLIKINIKNTSRRQSAGMQCKNDRAKVSPVIILLISQLGLLGLVWIITEAVMANQIAIAGPIASNLCPITSYLIQSNPSKLSIYNLATGQFGTATTITGLDSGVTLNAVGFNRLDGYMYGLEDSTSANKDLYRLDQSGNAVKIGNIAALATNASNAGDIDANGYYYVSNTNRTQVEIIDLNPARPATYGTKVGAVTLPSGATSGPDLAINPIDGRLYTIRFDTKELWSFKIDVATQTVTSFTNHGKTTNVADGASTSLTAGAVFFDDSANFYAYDNTSAKLWKFQTSPTVSTAGRLVGTGTTVANNDGARCALAPVPSLGVDYGDAPDTGNGTATGNYETLDINNGPHHAISTGLQLGSSITADKDGFSDGIDNNSNATDDSGDDGVQFGSSSLQGQSLTAGQSVTLNVTTQGNGVLNTWIDWNENGNFEDAGEKIATNVAPTANTISLNVTVPSGAKVGTTYARFRFSSDTALTSTGYASNGEVEDYQIAIKQTQTINNTPSATSCSVLGGTLSGNNLFTPLDNGTFGVENGSPNQSPAINPYSGIVTGGIYKYFYSMVQGDYSYVANPVTPRNIYQHPGITDPVYGVTGRFFASDPNTSTPTLTTTLTGLTPNQFYEYSFWAANSEPNGNPNNVDVKINNQTIYSTGPLPAISTALEWKKHTVSFTNGPSTSITIDLKSTQTGSSGNDFYLDNIELRDCNFTVDYGDAPPSYGNTIHTTIPATPTVYLGAIAPDGETSTPLGGDNGAGADGDDANQSSDDEDAFTALNGIPTTGTYALNNIPVKNTSGGNVTLHAWIDFDKDGKFAAGEYQSTTVANNANTANLSWTVPNTAIAGNTYARFRITPNALTDNATTTDLDERSINAVINGEVEDYQVAIAPPILSDPKLLLVKRITAINPGQPDAIQFDNFVDDTSTLNDNASNWPDSDGNPSNNINTYLRGETGAIPANIVKIKPGDEVEYTIYFLSNGDAQAKNINICDVVPDNMTFVANSYAANFGMALALNATALPTTTNKNLSNAIGDDEGDFYPPSTNPAVVNLCKKHDADNPNNLIPLDSSKNLSGAVLINLSNPLPAATSSGVPSNSYGFVRFRAKVK